MCDLHNQCKCFQIKTPLYSRISSIMTLCNAKEYVVFFLCLTYMYIHSTCKYIFLYFDPGTLYQLTGPLISWPTFPSRSMVLVYR